ncbi:unnamed protein product [Hydatigera taeniaeformis]|uniref:VPS13_C domain-containing protein n=1 Tax=Hydatigena taeniaeformis TaxID=6205 RepID=A0A0R3X7L2_HYDTA|nr:unnamed protein product [Hydatigera taeniaeformis]
MDCFSNCDLDTWLTSLDATSRDKVVELTLPQIQIRGPRFQSTPLLQSQNIPSSAPLSATEGTGGIRLYSFELEEKQALGAQHRLRHNHDAPDIEAVDLIPNRPMWEGAATGAAISIGEATRLLQLADLTCTLSFVITTSQPGNALSTISWSLLFDIVHRPKSTPNDSLRLRDVIHIMAAISDIQMRISNLLSEIFATKRLIGSQICKTKDVDSLSNASTSTETTPCGMELFSSTKKSSSIVSCVNHSSSCSLAESRNATLHLTPPNMPRTSTSRVPIRGAIQVMLPITSGELCLSDEQSKIIWEANNFRTTISIYDTPFYLNLRLQLERTAFYEESEVNQRRPKPQEPQRVDSDSEVDVTPSCHFQSTSQLVISLTRCPAAFLCRFFGNKRFSHWLDRQSERFLQGEDRIKLDDVGPPFVNCVYIKLKPLDVVLCPQLAFCLKDDLNVLHDSKNIVSTNSRRSFGVQAPLSGNCMPLLFIALDELRLFVPSSGLLHSTCGTISSCDTLAITLCAMQIHPFPTNRITSRPEAASIHSKAITLTSKVGSVYEDRQFALRLKDLACSAVNFVEALNFTGSAHSLDYQPTLIGQYPAFEWNQAATRLNDIKDAVWILPILRPLDITAVFAAPVCETNLTYGQRRQLKELASLLLATTNCFWLTFPVKIQRQVDNDLQFDDLIRVIIVFLFLLQEQHFHAVVRIQRDLTFVFTPNMLLHLSHADDEIRFDTQGIQMYGTTKQKKDWRGFYSELKMRCIGARLNEFQLIPTSMEISLRLCTEVSLMSIPTTVIRMEISRGTKIVIPFRNEFKRLVQAFIIAMHQENNNILKVKKPSRWHLPSRCVFHDDLRRKLAYDFSFFVPTESTGFADISQWLPLPYEVVFAEFDQFALADAADSNCVTMTWTFPELRQPIRLTMNPIPFFYGNDVGELGNVLLPGRLQYWSDYVGDYGGFVTYAAFNLLENASVDVLLPQTLAEFPHSLEIVSQAQRQQLVRGFSLSDRNVLWGPMVDSNSNLPLPVASKSWRVLISCVGRITSTEKSASPECKRFTIPVSFSPYALAACAQLDSVYIPEFTTPVSFCVRLDDFCLSTWQACHPFGMPEPSLEMGRLTVLKLRAILATSFGNPPNQAPAIIPALDQSITHAESTLTAGIAVESMAIHVFSPHGAHMQLLGEVEHVFSMNGACISIGTCHLCCSSDLVHALSQIITGEGKTGWEICNRTDRRLIVEQYFSYSSADGPAASALSNIMSVIVEAGGCFTSWRPIVMAKTRTITLRISLCTSSKMMVRSAPLSTAWPPEHAHGTFAQPIQWDDAEPQDDFFPFAILLIPPRSSSGLPGEASIAIIIHPTFTMENKLPIDLSLRLPNGLTKCITASSSYGLCFSPKATPELALSALRTDAFVPLEIEKLTAQEERILWLPVAETACSVLLKVNHVFYEMVSDPVRLITITPVLSITNALPILLTLVSDASCKSSVSFLTSSGQGISRSFEIPKESTTSVLVAFQRGSVPALNFQYPDKTPVFGSSLLLPWRALSGHLDVVVQPWLLISNRSGICLQLCTASNLKDINLPDESAVRFDSSSCHIPAAGERLFRFGISLNGNTVWSPALLVHKSVFSPSITVPSEAVTLTVSGVSRTQQQRNRGGSAAAEAVVSLTRSCTLAPLALRLGRVVCCLVAHLYFAPPRGVVTISIEPLLSVGNRTGHPLFCQPIVTPALHVHQSLPMASLDELRADVLALPKSGDNLTPILFWNNSHPEVDFDDADLYGVSFAHLLVLRSHSGTFWSRSLHLTGVYSFDGVRSCSATFLYNRYYHISLPTLNEDGDTGEWSVLLNLCNDLHTGLWTLYLDNFAPSLSYSLGCSLTNETDFLFEASFLSLSNFHQLPVSNALPCVPPSGGKLVLIPQISLDHLAGVRIDGETSAALPVSTFLCHEDAHLFLRLHSDDVVIKVADCKDSPIPLRFGNKTVFVQQIANGVLPFCTDLTIFTDQKPMFSHWPRADQPLSLTVFIDTTLIFAPVCGSVLPLGASGLKDFLRVCIRRIGATYTRRENAFLFDFSITSSLIQIDNLAQITLSTFDFPVLMRSVLPCTVEENGTGVASCTCQVRYLSPTDFLFDSFYIRLPSIEAYLEDSMLYALALWMQDLRGALPARVGGDVEDTVNLQTSTILCLHKFEIHSVSLQLALKVKVGMHITCKTTQFRLNSFECSEAVLDTKTLFSQLSMHYISQVLIRAGLVLGSLELIGNPACLVASFAEGVWDLVHFADGEKTATQEQLNLLRGLARGLVSLAKHTTGGVCSSLTGLASSVARNLHELSLDEEHIRRTTEIRQHHQLAGLGEGLRLGISELGLSLLGALAGVAHHPLFALLQSQSPFPSSSPSPPPHRLVRMAEEFAGGVGRGLIGLLVKPLAGVADFVAFTGAGFMHGMGTGWGITSPPVHMCCLTSLPDVSHLVDGALLHKWSCALMRSLNVPHPHKYLWTGVCVDTTRTVLTWLCLPCYGPLFTIEFKVHVQTVQMGVLGVDFEDTSQDVLVNRYHLSAGEKDVLLRALRNAKGTMTAIEGYDVVGDSETSHHLERVRTYLSGLSHPASKQVCTQ